MRYNSSIYQEKILPWALRNSLKLSSPVPFIVHEYTSCQKHKAMCYVFLWVRHSQMWRNQVLLLQDHRNLFPKAGKNDRLVTCYSFVWCDFSLQCLLVTALRRISSPLSSPPLLLLILLLLLLCLLMSSVSSLTIIVHDFIIELFTYKWNNFANFFFNFANFASKLAGC